MLGLLVVAVLLGSLPNLYAASKSKGASISLRARWNGTAYMTEAAEFLAEEGLLWSFLSKTSSTPGPVDPELCWEHITALATENVPKGIDKLLPLSLRSRQYSARLEMYRQLTSELVTPEGDSCCFVDINDTLLSSAAAVTAALKPLVDSETCSNATAAHVFDFDHVYGDKKAAHTVILYGPPGAKCLGQLSALLSAAVDKVTARLAYIWRPYTPAGCQLGACAALGQDSPVWLSGYGVEAALKNTEYSAMDDSQKGEEAEGDDEGLEGSAGLGEVSGFMFNTLVDRRPGLKEELLTLRDHLEASAADSEDTEGSDLKLWAMRDLGLQATQRVAQASDPLGLLMDISQNFPGLAPSLSKQKVNSSLRQAVAFDQNFMSSGTSFLMLNGMAVEVDPLDFYSLLDRLRIEVRLRNALDQLGLPASEAMRLLALRVDVSGGADSMVAMRLNLAMDGDAPGAIPAEVSFCNDLEVDQMYAHLPKKLKELLNTFPGRMRPIARNLFTVVAIVDPMSKEGLALAETFYQLYAESYPIRFGLAMVVPESIKRVRQSGVGAEAPEWTELSSTEQFALAFLTLRDAFGGQPAFSFWSSVAQGLSDDLSGADASFVIQSAFEDNWKLVAETIKSTPGASDATKAAAQTRSLDAWVQLTGAHGHSAAAATALAATSAFMLSKGISSLGPAHLWFNGKLEEMDCSDQLSNYLLQKVMQEQNKLQEGLYYGKIKDTSKVPVLAQIFKRYGSISRWNPTIINSVAAKDEPVLPTISHELKAARDLVDSLSIPGHTAGVPRIHAATHYVIADLGSQPGRALLKEAMRFLSSDEETDFMAANSRVVLLPNPSNLADSPSLLEALVLLATASPEADKDVPTFILSLLSDDTIAEGLAKPSSLRLSVPLLSALKEHAVAGNMESDTHLWKNIEGGTSIELEKERAALEQVVRNGFRLKEGDNAIFSNGKLFMCDSAQSYFAEDFKLLQMIIKDYSPAGAISDTLQAAYDEGRMGAFAPPVPSEDADGMPVSSSERHRAASVAVSKMDDLVTSVIAILSAVEYPESRISLQQSKQIQNLLGSLQSKAIEIGDGVGGAMGVHIVAVLDPLSRTAQRLSQLLSTLVETAAPSLSLRLNPDMALTQLPIKTYYRYALPTTKKGPPSGAAAHFARLPSKRILTMNMDVPEPWLVEVVQAPYDLDNLLLADVSGGIARAEFELEGLVLTGSCIDVTAGANRGTPPRGLQLWMGTPSNPHNVDTLVMENLAYFQLKTKPGRWLLSLAPGRSQALYTLLPATGGVAPRTAVAEAAVQEELLSTEVVVGSLSGKNMILRVKKRPGMETEDVLGPKEDGDGNGDDDDDDDDDAYSSYYDDEPKKKKKQAKLPATASTAPATTGVKDDTINVFTVASGHMYERLQKIMILSVLRKTKRRVKFWIIKNYMSPHHRTVMPLMAKEYGFDYEFVTYKWPHWLHKQSDKQRIIWAYKILFLDVLFPLDVERIIFIDSDQVIRADLGELMDMDIKGAPFAYTPFCDNNREMDEFRFWKGGFWKDHLRGKPYHISALYLVDLKRFRQKAAGDNLRIVYEQLSRDPNSLANLDQDLPNYAQHSIPIFSLPQEWLWCESWCGNSTKKKAKTIDLCNNPRTKEPKLSAARRIVPEWAGLDDEQAAFTARVEAAVDMAGPLASEEEVAAAVAASKKGTETAHDASEL